jgi:hypothetical protein
VTAGVTFRRAYREKRSARWRTSLAWLFQMRAGMHRPLAPLVLVCGACCFLSRAAIAQDSGATAAADTLFREGRQLFDDKRYDEACPKLAESFRIDPATGALLALAACHEAQGKTASAWTEYNEVVARARREGRADRADAAQQRSDALESKLSKLTVILGPGTSAISGLVVRRDGIVLGAGALGAALPVDPGDHTVDASAPNRQPWVIHVTITVDGGTAMASVPPLGETPTWATTERDTTPSALPLRPIGIATGAAGIVALGVSTYFAVRAASKNSDSKTDCLGDVCGTTGRQQRLDALSAANVSTVMFVVGAVLAAGGVTLFVLGKPTESKPTIAAVPTVDKQGAGFALSGSF